MRLKNIYGGKSHLFAYVRFCAFYAREEKGKEENRKRKKSPQCNVLGSRSMQM